MYQVNSLVYFIVQTNSFFKIIITFDVMLGDLASSIKACLMAIVLPLEKKQLH